MCGYCPTIFEVLNEMIYTCCHMLKIHGKDLGGQWGILCLRDTRAKSLGKWDTREQIVASQ